MTCSRVVIGLISDDLFEALDVTVDIATHHVVSLHSTRLLVSRAWLSCLGRDEVAMSVGQRKHAHSVVNGETKLHIGLQRSDAV